MNYKYADTPESIRAAVREVASRDDVEGILLCAAPDDEFDEWLDPFLRGLAVSVFGGLFPEIIHDGENKRSGAVVCGLSSEPNVTTVHGLSNTDPDSVHHKAG